MAGEKTIGFIADQIVNVIPEWVSEYDVKLEESDEEKTQVKRIITNDLQYILVKAIQELSKQNEELSNRLIKLESK
jgi:site-specific DNA-adenine methylase